MREQYIAIIGDQSETQQCFGTFPDTDTLFRWTASHGISDERVSFYRMVDITTVPDGELAGVAQ